MAKKAVNLHDGDVHRMRVGDIVCEFALPTRLTKKAIILCSGVPSLPSKSSMMTFLAKKGFAVFYPRYRGTWESEGEFLAQSPDEDIREVIDAFAQPIVDVRTKASVQLHIEKLFVVGSSFGGPAALLLARDPRVKKVVALSPVVDWTAPSKEEPMDWFGDYLIEAFGAAHRFARTRWEALSRGEFYQPVAHVKEIDGSKVLIFHAQDDAVVGWRPVERFARRVQAAIVMRKRGGHFGTSEVMQPQVWKRIAAHFR